MFLFQKNYCSVIKFPNFFSGTRSCLLTFHSCKVETRYSTTHKRDTSKWKQVGSPTKARARFLKIGLPLNWKASVGFTKWGTVIFSDLVSKGRLARPGWQG